MAHSLLIYVPFISHYLYWLAIYYIINARTLSSYIFIWTTSAHTDLNNVGLLQYCDLSLSSIMMYMSRLTVIFQKSGTITQHAYEAHTPLKLDGIITVIKTMMVEETCESG